MKTATATPTASVHPRSFENRMRVAAERIGLRVSRMPQHPGYFLVLDPATASILSPPLHGLAEVERFLRVPIAEHAVKAAEHAVKAAQARLAEVKRAALVSR